VNEEEHSAAGYYGQMNSEIFKKWVAENLVPNLPPHAVIVLGNKLLSLHWFPQSGLVLKSGLAPWMARTLGGS
jgi:hypothetical protein